MIKLCGHIVFTSVLSTVSRVMVYHHAVGSVSVICHYQYHDNFAASLMAVLLVTLLLLKT